MFLKYNSENVITFTHEKKGKINIFSEIIR